MIFEWIEWDEDNLLHATRRASVEEIEQALFNADRAVRSRHQRDRLVFRSVTDGGRRLVVVAPIVGSGVRPITAWDE